MSTGSPAAPQLDIRTSAGVSPSRTLFSFTRRTRLALWLVLGATAVIEVAFELALYLRPALLGLIVGADNLSALQNEWLRPIACGSLGMAAFFFLRAAGGLASRTFASAPGRSEKGGLSSDSLEHFVEEAQRLHIDPQIARETFHLFVSLLPATKTFGLNDDLREVLGLTNPQVTSLLSALPDLCDRPRLPVDPASILSVYDLLQYVESLPRHQSGQTTARTGLPVGAAATPPPSPLANLQNASPRDSRFRTRAHFSGVKRRASDYSGPYRRATDRRPDENYRGPYRRASDREDTGDTGVSVDTRVGERRSSERRGATAQEGSEQARQHRAVSADSSLLNQCVDISKARPGSDSNRNFAPATVADENNAHPVIGLQRG